jgi:DNA-directed RNA polymerase subunit RPC12/RpoP
MAEPSCLRCGQLMSSNDTIAFDAKQIVHLDCRRPRELNHEERALLFRFCWDHVVAECGACRQRFRRDELAADLSAHRTHQCPRCRADLTVNIREHLFSCALVPTEVRWRAEDARDAARRLIKQRQELLDQVDALVRAAELAIAALRETMQRVM